MSTLTPNYNLEKPEATDPFGDFRQSYNGNLDIIDANLGGGGGGGGHTIVDENGSDMPAESKLQFTGNVSVTDDNVNGATVVDVSGGSNLILNAQKYSDNETVVGVWRDNKPLYAKTVHISALPSSATSQTYPHNIANIDKICHYESISRASSGVSVILNRVGLNGSNVNGAISYDLYVNKTNITISVGQDQSGIEADVTIWYTKTTDTAGSGGYEAYGFSPVIYSDVERKIGVWRDNKPLYQKTFHISLLLDTPNTWYQTNIGLSANNIETVAHIVQAISDTGAVWDNIGLTIDRSAYVELISSRNSGGVKIEYLTIQYTKTTDVAGSGDYNTYGVPTVHYSTSEQVIGTWLDGRPIYQKTVPVTSNIPYNTWQNTGVLVDANADDVINVPQARAQTGSSNMSLLAYFNNGVLVVMNMRNVNYGTNYKYYVTVQYTKSTDL